MFCLYCIEHIQVIKLESLGRDFLSSAEGTGMNFILTTTRKLGATWWLLKKGVEVCEEILQEKRSGYDIFNRLARQNNVIEKPKSLEQFYTIFQWIENLDKADFLEAFGNVNSQSRNTTCGAELRKTSLVTVSCSPSHFQFADVSLYRALWLRADLALWMFTSSWQSLRFLRLTNWVWQRFFSHHLVSYR